MKKINLSFILLLLAFSAQSQSFVRSELPTSLSTPWEITCGPDDFLWVTEDSGRVSRIDPTNGDKTIVYTASDYFPGSSIENKPGCNSSIGAGTLGLALDPDFTDPAKAYIYFVYSYNSGTTPVPATKFKIKRLKWDATTKTVTNNTDLVSSIATGYGHIGGRLLAVKQNAQSYLYLSTGDHGGSSTCYVTDPVPADYTQDPNTQIGKILRYNIDGTIPADNPISGNSFYTRGHRNPQGLMYNTNLDVLYNIEHGPETDDEINILYKGMNYGWKDVSGYHDGNYAEETDYVTNYTPHPSIANDSLVQPFYAWGTTYNAGGWLAWGTVAPSDGIYYGSDGIPEWKNSLLIVTLKNGNESDQELYQLKLLENGEIAPSTEGNPNPKRFFGADQALNGRLRDVAFSNDGKTIYLINNRYIKEKVSIYTYCDDIWYADTDEDSFGDPNASTTACSQPAGYVSNADDCNDTDKTFTTGDTWYADTDEDGFGDANATTTACTQPAGYAINADDCDDTNDTVYPGAVEITDNLDNDCNGEIDEHIITGVESEKKMITISPNPTEKELTIRLDKVESGYSVHIISMSGKVLMSQEIYKSETVLDVSGMVNGMYVVKLYQRDKLFESKLIIKK